MCKLMYFICQDSQMNRNVFLSLLMGVKRLAWVYRGVVRLRAVFTSSLSQIRPHLLDGVVFCPCPAQDISCSVLKACHYGNPPFSPAVSNYLRERATLVPRWAHGGRVSVVHVSQIFFQGQCLSRDHPYSTHTLSLLLFVVLSVKVQRCFVSIKEYLLQNYTKIDFIHANVTVINLMALSYTLWSTFL